MKTKKTQIAVTGAAGKTGLAVTAALARRGVAVRALIRRPAQDDPVRAAGAADVVRGDLRDAEALDRLLGGVEALYHLAPNVDPEEEAIGRAVLDAARRQGVERIVYHSVLHPQIEAMPHHWRKMRVEEMLFASSLRFTVLQPAAYMQNVLAHRDSIVRHGVLPIPYAPEARFSLVDLGDVAEVAAAVLTEEGHEHAVYELAGPETLDSHALADHLGRTLGRPVRAERVDRDAWAEQARAGGLDAPRLEALLAMFRYYDAAGLVGNANILRRLLGREPTHFADFARRAFARPSG